jgi:flagellar protein FliL
MAKKKKAEEGSEEESTEKSGGGKMMPAAMISIALVAAGYFVGGRGGGDAATTTVTSIVEVEKEEPHVGDIIDLEPVNVNLAGGHYLRVAISIGMAAHEEETAEGGDSGHGAKEEKTVTTEPTAPAADLVLSTFSGKTVEELSTLEGRIQARESLHEGLKEFYGEEVLTVFFTEFVMQ